jgi:hypothetical protein
VKRYSASWVASLQGYQVPPSRPPPLHPALRRSRRVPSSRRTGGSAYRRAGEPANGRPGVLAFSARTGLPSEPALGSPANRRAGEPAWGEPAGWRKGVGRVGEDGGAAKTGGLANGRKGEVANDRRIRPAQRPDSVGRGRAVRAAAW